MKPLVIAMPGNESMAGSIASSLVAEVGSLSWRRFPDGESYVRLESDVSGREVILVSSLFRPDEKILPLLFAADAAREFGARRVILAAPYLGYMRQDHRFKEGEAVTSRSFAGLLSAHLDGLVTVDPHLHRYKSLSEVYSVPAVAVHATALLARWVREHVKNPVIVGPDSESEQWAREVASGAEAPVVVLEKTRKGDREVEIVLPSMGEWRSRVPVLVDDIISTARTMTKVVELMRAAGAKPPACLGVHAVFADTAYADLLRTGPLTVITCDTIPHPSNGIKVGPLLSEALKSLLPQQ